MITEIAHCAFWWGPIFYVEFARRAVYKITAFLHGHKSRMQKC